MMSFPLQRNDVWGVSRANEAARGVLGMAVASARSYICEYLSGQYIHKEVGLIS
jgi:hypothetical protein